MENKDNKIDKFDETVGKEEELTTFGRSTKTHRLLYSAKEKARVETPAKTPRCARLY